MKQGQAQESRLVLWILWGALSASQLLYVAVMLVAPLHKLPITGEPAQRLILALGACGLGGTILGFLLPAWIARSSAKPATTFAAAEKAIFGAFVLRLCVFEMVCVLGFVAGFLTANIQAFLPFLSLSILGFFSSVPRDSFIISFSGRANLVRN